MCTFIECAAVCIAVMDTIIKNKKNAHRALFLKTKILARPENSNEGSGNIF